jgi:general secretion pathway protein A
MEPDKGPFSLSPDPKFLYMTPLLKTSVHKLKYVIERRQGVTAILGDLGTGKSSLTRLIFREFILRDEYRVAMIPNPAFKSDYGFLRAICGEFRLPPRRSLLDQQEDLQRFVIEQFAAGVNVLLLVDEAQRLDTKMLEVVRTLLNFETDDAKCLQVVVAGQMELQERLSEKRNRSLKSRIFAPTILQPLSLDETRGMIAFRCDLDDKPNPFTVEAVEAIYEQTGGIPREVLKACQMAWDIWEMTGAAAIGPDVVPMAVSNARLP